MIDSIRANVISPIAIITQARRALGERPEGDAQSMRAALIRFLIVIVASALVLPGIGACRHRNHDDADG